MIDGSEIKLYLDGVLIGNGTNASTSLDTIGGDFYIGSKRSNWQFFNGAIDDVRIYDRALSQGEIQTLYKMGTPVGSSTSLPQGCPNIGDVCDDGSIYAGLSPDGNVEMYTTPQSVSGGTASWNNGGSNWVTTNIDNDDTGEANTAALVTIDSDSGAAGFQTHESAQHCYDLKQHGADDWYLPATNELQLLYDNLVDADNSYNFDLFQNQSSSERSSNTFHCIDFSNGSGCGPLKDRTRSFRCVRKGPAPRCANPYGVEGQMVYNGDYDVVQFCDGARWRAVGKYGP